VINDILRAAEITTVIMHYFVSFVCDVRSFFPWTYTRPILYYLTS